MGQDVLKDKFVHIMANFIGLVAIKLPRDVSLKLEELARKETDSLAQNIYQTMFANQELAYGLKRPSCQDTGIVQFFCEVGEDFPLRAALEELLPRATAQATSATPLRPNSVETFQEHNTGNNVATGSPTIYLRNIPNSSDLKIYTYLAGGGCSLPGAGQVFVPGQGYEAVVRFVLDRVTEYGLNACPPFLLGLGIGTSIDTAAINSKLALLRDVGKRNQDSLAADLESRLEEGINQLGIGPQGLGGRSTVLAVHIVNTARHPGVLAAALSFACWSHRRGCLILDRDLNYRSPSHQEFFHA